MRKPQLLYTIRKITNPTFWRTDSFIFCINRLVLMKGYLCIIFRAALTSCRISLELPNLPGKSLVLSQILLLPLSNSGKGRNKQTKWRHLRKCLIAERLKTWECRIKNTLESRDDVTGAKFQKGRHGFFSNFPQDDLC